MAKKGNDSSAPQFTDQQKADYLAANPDVAADPYYGKNPGDHYNKLGQYENRATAPAPEPASMPSIYDGYSQYLENYNSMMSEYTSRVEKQQSDYAKQVADANAESERLAAQAAAEKEKKYRALATDTVDKSLTYNENQAKLRGLKYTAPDDSQYKKLIDDEYKKLTGSATSTVAETTTKKNVTTKGTVNKKKSTDLDEDETLSKPTLLGG